MKEITYSELLRRKGNKIIGYEEILKTVEWQKKRNVILDRDGNRCTKCNLASTFDHYSTIDKKSSHLTDDGTEEHYIIKKSDGSIEEGYRPKMIATDKKYRMHVHHKYYIENTLPWDYDNGALITLCNWCHQHLHDTEEIFIYTDNTMKFRSKLKACNRCNGSGYFEQYKHVESGVCFECRGDRFTKSLIEINDSKVDSFKR